jgi:Spy/CpxP family protein refolding chaperone
MTESGVDRVKIEDKIEQVESKHDKFCWKIAKRVIAARATPEEEKQINDYRAELKELYKERDNQKGERHARDKV